MRVTEIEMEQEVAMMEIDSPKDQYLIFSVGEEAFGIDINQVIEIIKMELITIVPDLPEYIKGVINLRGKVIPIMDVRVRFQKPEKEFTDRTCIIVVEIDHIFMGLIIDEVLEVTNIEEKDIMQPPKSGKEKENITNLYVWGFVKSNDSVKLLIDGKKLLEK